MEFSGHRFFSQNVMDNRDNGPIRLFAHDVGTGGHLVPIECVRYASHALDMRRRSLLAMPGDIAL